jgi:hypothetical protein
MSFLGNYFRKYMTTNHGLTYNVQRFLQINKKNARAMLHIWKAKESLIEANTEFFHIYRDFIEVFPNC